MRIRSRKKKFSKKEKVKLLPTENAILYRKITVVLTQTVSIKERDQFS